MSNIRDLTSKQRGSDSTSDKCFSAPRSGYGERRIDFRKKDGSRFSLPYSHLVDVIYMNDDDGVETVRLDYTNFWHVTLTGTSLLPIYEALQNHDVIWVSEADGDVENGESKISFVTDTKLTDPTLAWESLQEQKKAILGE